MIKDFKEWLLEHPQLVPGNAPFEEENEIISSISERIMNQDYSLVKENIIKDLDLYKHNKNNYYVVGEFYNHNNEVRFGIVTDLSFSKKDNMLSKQKQLNSKIIYIINTIHTNTEWRGKGISTALYKFIINSGITIISDSIQYEGAKNLWKKFPQVPNAVVYIYDILEDKIISKYTSNTPDNHIWSDDASKRRIRLVFTKK